MAIDPVERAAAAMRAAAAHLANNAEAGAADREVSVALGSAGASALGILVGHLIGHVGADRADELLLILVHGIARAQSVASGGG